MTNFTTVDGDKFHYIKQESYTHLHIVIRKWKMVYDKGCLFIYGIMNSSLYTGLIAYDKYGNITVKAITGDGLSYAYGGLEENGELLRIVLNVRQYSVYTIQGTDQFEIARTTG